jgi:hypothetical protein
MRSETVSSTAVRAVLAAVVLCFGSSAFAQAWTPPAGSGSIWLTAQTLHADAHTLGDGRYTHNIDLRANSMTLGLDYGLTDRLALSLALPYVTSRYRGRAPHAGSSVDDGEFHGAVSDVDLELRYKALDGLFVITPYVGGQWPTRNYPTLGHATPGRGLTEYAVGVDIGHEAGWLVPGLFFGAGYTYNLVEKIDEDLDVNRSNLDLRAAYYLTPRLSLQAASMWQRTHGGLDLPLSAADAAHHLQHHDQMLRADHWRASVAVSYAVHPSVDVFVGYATSIESENSHAFRTLTAGAGWSFAGPTLRTRTGDWRARREASR